MQGLETVELVFQQTLRQNAELKAEQIPEQNAEQNAEHNAEQTADCCAAKNLILHTPMIPPEVGRRPNVIHTKVVAFYDMLAVLNHLVGRSVGSHQPPGLSSASLRVR